MLLALLLAASPAHAADVGPAEHELPAALVEIDGQELFRVRGTTAYPAELRAQAIAGRIQAVAASPDFRTETLRAVPLDFGTAIIAGRERLLVLTESDARLEGVGRGLLTEEYLGRIREAMDAYRQARSRDALTASSARALAAVAAFALATALVLWLWRRLHVALEHRLRDRVRGVGIQSLQIVRAERIWVALRAVLGALRTALIAVLAFACLYEVLSQFPWTQGTASRLLEHVLSPLKVLAGGLIASIPSLLFLVVLFILTRYLLKVLHLLFGAVGRREVVFDGFEAEWAEPTYKLVRLAVVVLALVVAYPYIPGSGSDAFKGITLFVGIVLSLGSSAAMANVIAGYLMTYRRAFRVGDRVKIGGITGEVTEMRLQVTHLRTTKNEEVTLPNSSILNNEVINYSTLAQQLGLVLHTTVSIGYETPWRQVEAMLLAAAQRTPGLPDAASAYVHQKELGERAVTYELNVRCGTAHGRAAMYTALHRNILDVFNEYGVQIMTPGYEGDPEQPKVVPRERWFLAPADPEPAADKQLIGERS